LSTAPTFADDDACPYCLRGVDRAHAQAEGRRFCGECGGDWGALLESHAPGASDESEAAAKWKSDSVVLPLPKGEAERPWHERDTGPVPALSAPNVRAAAAPLELPDDALVDDDALLEEDEADDDEADDDEAFHDPTGAVVLAPAFTLLPALPTPDADASQQVESPPGRENLSAEDTDTGDPAPVAPPPLVSPNALVASLVGAAILLAVVVARLVDTPVAPAPAAVPSAPSVAQTAPAPAPSAPSLPTPAHDATRRSLAVTQNIERALDEAPQGTEAEIGVRVDDDVAFLLGQVESHETLDRVTAAARGTFGVRAVDTREVKVQRRVAPVHTVLAGDTLADLARKYYGRAGAWRRIYEVNPGIDPNLILVGQPLSLPPELRSGSAQ
jgi:nucleoid-associated protein YgaU